MTAPVIRLHVERLVLDGVELDPRDAPRLREALQAELGRLLAEGGLHPALAGGGSRRAVDAAPLQTAPGQAPDALGTDLARSVYAGLGPGP
jgi:hypothetical protein